MVSHDNSAGIDDDTRAASLPTKVVNRDDTPLNQTNRFEPLTFGRADYFPILRREL